MSSHNWKPTTNTLAVWKCTRCGSVGFDPHPLPRDGCPETDTEVTDLRLDSPDVDTKARIGRSRLPNQKEGTHE